MTKPSRSPPPQLPLREGVSASCLVLPPSRHPQWPSLLDALAACLPRLSRDEWQQRLHTDQVCNAQGQPLAAGSIPQGGQRVYYWRHVADEPELPFAHRIVFQDEHLVVADKPHFMPVTPGGRYVHTSLLVRLKRELGLAQLSPIHRIDRETAGLVAFSVRPQDRDAYQGLFRERQVGKVYQAIAPTPRHLPVPAWPVTRHSHLRENPLQFFRMEEAPETSGLPPNSETRIEALRHHGPWTLYRLTPITGKRHQLRVHMAAMGLPLVGDQFYPDVVRPPDGPDNHAQPLRLLASELVFTDPVTGQARRFVSQLSLAWPDP